MRFTTTARRFAALLLAIGLLGAAQATELPPAKLFFDRPDIGAMAISPDGKRIALSVIGDGDRMALYVMDVASREISRLTTFKEADVRGLAWAGDENVVIRVGNLNEERGSREWEGSRTFVVDLKLRRRMLADPKNRSYLMHWTPRHVVIGRAQEDHIALRRHPLDSEEVIPYQPALQQPFGTVDWLFDPEGEPRVAFTQAEEEHAAYWRAPGRREWQLLYKARGLHRPFTPAVVDGEGQLYVVAREGEASESVIKRFDFARMEPGETVAAVPGFDISPEAVLHPVSGKLLGLRIDAERESTIWFDAQLKELQAKVDQRYPGRVNEISCARCGAADMLLLVHSHSDQQPGEWRLHDVASGEWRLLGRAKEGLDPVRMAKKSLHRIAARDGRDLPVWLTRAPNAPADAPAVVLVHGGPWVRGGYWAWDGMAQFLASRGYVVIEPEFRGSKGFGWAHYEAGHRQWGAAMQDDVADALLWAQKQGLTGGKACIAGASYGGYSTLMGLVRHPELYRCGAAWAAVTDLELWMKGSWRFEDDVHKVARRLSAPLIGEPGAALFERASPVLLADKIKRPVLLAHGENDWRVPVAHGTRMRSALASAGNKPEWVHYEDEGHGWERLKNQLDFASRLERFLARHLQ